VIIVLPCSRVPIWQFAHTVGADTLVCVAVAETAR